MGSYLISSRQYFDETKSRTKFERNSESSDGFWNFCTTQFNNMLIGTELGHVLRILRSYSGDCSCKWDVCLKKAGVKYPGQRQGYYFFKILNCKLQICTSSRKFLWYFVIMILDVICSRMFLNFINTYNLIIATKFSQENLSYSELMLFFVKKTVTTWSTFISQHLSP